MQTRPPVVAVLGHVDHGKTTLLDSIRKTNVVSREAGGITQSIGASCVTTKEGKQITFIDTPGHAAFSQMRSRGAKVADIAVLVVSADAGVKPQTKESLEAIHQANLPFVVVVTKTDLPSADIEGVLGQLEKEGVKFEGKGGNTPQVSVSAKRDEGMTNLLEVISLLAEVSGIKGLPTGSLEAVVIETTKDSRGLLVSVVVKDGKLGVSQTVYAKDIECKIKALFNYQGKSVKEVLPGEPAQILGFSRLPAVGETISAQKGERQPELPRVKRAKAKKGDLILSLKAQTKGALEAITGSLPPAVVITETGVGDVSQSDVLMAKAANARIFAFESKLSPSVAKLADAESVKIEKFAIIYELLDRVEEILSQGEVEILGKAEIIATFPFNAKKIAGCRLVQGKIGKTDKIVVRREDKDLGRVKIISMKKQKTEINQASAGEEIGVLFEPQLDFQVKDVLVSVAQ